jgi:CheY-like chemotaxis protein
MQRSFRYKCEFLRSGCPTNYGAHATTAHKRFHRPQSSLRLGCLLDGGRGRFFPIMHLSVAAIRPLIAVIEADARDRRTLCSLLSTLDVDVKDFDSAESYLAAPGSAPGCLITEVALPGMSGLDLLRLLRAAGMLPPIILLGEESDVRAAVTAMREGAIDFIEKPHVDMAILRRVAYLLDHSAAVVKH